MYVVAALRMGTHAPTAPQSDTGHDAPPKFACTSGSRTVVTKRCKTHSTKVISLNHLLKLFLRSVQFGLRPRNPGFFPQQPTPQLLPEWVRRLLSPRLRPPREAPRGVHGLQRIPPFLAGACVRVDGC